MKHLSRHPLKLSEFRIHMEEGPKMRPLPVTADFWEQLAKDPHLAGGRFLSFYSANDPDDLHPDF